MFPIFVDHLFICIGTAAHPHSFIPQPSHSASLNVSTGYVRSSFLHRCICFYSIVVFRSSNLLYLFYRSIYRSRSAEQRRHVVVRLQRCVLFADISVNVNIKIDVKRSRWVTVSTSECACATDPICNAKRRFREGKRSGPNAYPNRCVPYTAISIVGLGAQAFSSGATGQR